jgi:peptidyl-prolyl cis-trans isomerase C
MLKKIGFGVCAFFLLCFGPGFSLSGCSSNVKSSGGPVLARFDNDKITRAEFISRVEKLPKDLRSVAVQRKKDFLEDMASEHFLLKEAKRQGIENQKEVQDLIEAARRKIIVAKLIETEVDRKASVTDEEVTQYYDAHKDEFMTPLLFRASHILVKTLEEAQTIKAELSAGGDFEELARKKSMDMTAIRGGDLGFFQKGQFVPEFEDAVSGLTKGQISDPVKTQFGYHIIKLTDRAEPSLREFRTVKSLIQERLLNEKRSKIFKALIDKLRSGSKIQIDEKALETVSLDVPSKKS